MLQQEAGVRCAQYCGSNKVDCCFTPFYSLPVLLFLFSHCGSVPVEVVIVSLSCAPSLLDLFAWHKSSGFMAVIVANMKIICHANELQATAISNDWHNHCERVNETKKNKIKKIKEETFHSYRHIDAMLWLFIDGWDINFPAVAISVTLSWYLCRVCSDFMNLYADIRATGSSY